VGHVRNILLAKSIIRLSERAGNHVIKVQIVNNRGVHICKAMLAYQKWGNGKTPESEGMKPDHFVGKYYDYKAKSLEKLRHHNLKIYGYGWEAGLSQFPWLKEKYMGPLATEELNLVYNGTKVAIGTMGTPSSLYTTTTMRTYDIGLSGAFQVCEDSHLARKLFGETLGIFKDEAEMIELVDYYLIHDKEREEKAIRAHKIALEYTYTKAAKKILRSFGIEVETSSEKDLKKDIE